MWCPTSAPSTRCRHAASRPTRCAGAPRRSDRWPSWNTCWWPPRWPRAGWSRSPTTRAPTACGAHPHEPGYRVLDGLRATLNFERFGLAEGQPGRPVGLLRRRAGQRVGGRGARRVRPRAQHRRRRAGLAGGQPGQHLPPAQRLPPGGTARAGGLRAGQDLPRPEPGDRGARHRGRPRAAGPAGAHDHRSRRSSGCSGPTWTTWCTRRSRRCWPCPRSRTSSSAIKLGGTAPTPPVLIVQAVHDSVIAVDDIDELAHTYHSGGGAGDLPPRHVQRAHAAAPDVGADDAALAHRPLRRPPARRAHHPDHWPTLLNPMTYAGMWRLGGIVGPGDVGRPGSASARCKSPRTPQRRSACSCAGHAPRSSRGVATAINAYDQRRERGREQQRRRDLQRAVREEHRRRLGEVVAPGSPE